MAKERPTTFEAVEPIPAATRAALADLNVEHLNPAYLDTAVVASQDIAIPVVTFASMSRFFKRERTVHGYPAIYSTWIGLEHHIFDRHSGQDHRTYITPCDCALCAYVEQSSWTPIQTLGPHRYGILPEGLETAPQQLPQIQSKYRGGGINKLGAEVIAEFFEGIKA
ncbi:MAG TPA: hypothetical protein VG964_03140 [Candidatus Saccharimonadales bacterium]|nr:hypothetical protein [Candidatus Saccharimonadales bacterium]